MNLWFNNAVDTSPLTLGNYWQDAGCTVPAAALPNWAADTVKVVSTARMEQADGYPFGTPLTIAAGGTLELLANSVLSITSTGRIDVLGSLIGTGTVSLAGRLFDYASVIAPVTIIGEGTFLLGGTTAITGASGAVWPAEANVSTVETAYGPTGTEYAGELDLSLYTLISGVAGADDVRAATPRYTGGPNGNLIVPSAANLVDGAHAGWHHTGTPDTYEVTGTAIVIETSEADHATGTLIAYAATGLPASGIVISTRLVAAPDDDDTGHAYSTIVRTATSSAGGAVQFANLIQGATYEVWEGSGTPVEFTVPSNADPFELPTLLGDQQLYNVQQMGRN